MNKRGQVAAFIIIGIVIVAIILIFLFLRKDITPPNPVINWEENPEEYLENCVNEYVEQSFKRLFEHNFYVYSSPEKTINFSYPSGYERQGYFENVPYYCYTEGNYLYCEILEPDFVHHLEEEVKNLILSGKDECFESFEENLKRNGFGTIFGREKNFDVELVPGVFRTNVTRDVRIKKADKEERFEEFEFEFRTKAYDFAILVQEILRQESLWCNSKTEDLMRVYPWAEIEEYETGYQITIYRISDKETGDEIMFALRNCVLSVPS